MNSSYLKFWKLKILNTEIVDPRIDLFNLASLNVFKTQTSKIRPMLSSNNVLHGFVN